MRSAVIPQIIPKTNIRQGDFSGEQVILGLPSMFALYQMAESIM